MSSVGVLLIIDVATALDAVSVVTTTLHVASVVVIAFDVVSVVDTTLGVMLVVEKKALPRGRLD